jgi:hypothetical protein
MALLARLRGSKEVRAGGGAFVDTRRKGSMTNSMKTKAAVTLSEGTLPQFDLLVGKQSLGSFIELVLREQTKAALYA